MLNPPYPVVNLLKTNPRDQLIAMLTKILRIIRTTIIIFGSLLFFQVVINVMQAHQVLQNVHPVLGTLFLLTLAVACVATIMWYIISLKRHPLTLRPPPIRELGKANTKELRAYGKYLSRVMQRLARHKLLPENNRVALDSEDGRLREALVRKSDLTTMIDAIRKAEELSIKPAIKILDKLAEREVRDSVRDIMLGVTLSPWRSADLFVVLYRNGSMVVRITNIYNNRPRLREHFLILRDVIAVVATVNFLNYSSKLLQNLLSSVPLLGRFTDDIVEGVGAGLMTSVIGHTALMRCRAFHGWSEEEAQDTLRKQLSKFMIDIKKFVFDDILTELYKPVEALNPEFTREPGWIHRLRDEIADAIDDTTDNMDHYIKKPVVAVGRGVAKTGADITESTMNNIHASWKNTLTSIHKTLKPGVAWIGRKARRTAVKTEHQAKWEVQNVSKKQRKSQENDADTND